MKFKITGLLGCVFLFGLSVHASIESADNFKTCMETASNTKLNMNLRWMALVKSGGYAEGGQVAEIRKFIEDKEWYLRNAALVAINKVSHFEAQKDAKILLTDKALVVRSAAVEVCRKI